MQFLNWLETEMPDSFSSINRMKKNEILLIIICKTLNKIVIK